MTPLLQAEGLSRRVGGAWLWRALSLSLQPGERLAVAGRSGAGKSLLLRTLVGLEPTGEGGCVRYRGRPLDARRLPDYRREVVYLPQKAVPLADRVDADLNAVFSWKTGRAAGGAARPLAERLSALGRPPAFLEKATADLSGGELQLLALLRALQLEPRVLLLDEPTGALDEAATRRVEAVLADWQASGPDRGLVLVSHSADQRRRLTEREIQLGDA